MLSTVPVNELRIWQVIIDALFLGLATNCSIPRFVIHTSNHHRKLSIKVCTVPVRHPYDAVRHISSSHDVIVDEFKSQRFTMDNTHSTIVILAEVDDPCRALLENHDGIDFGSEISRSLLQHYLRIYNSTYSYNW
ncbi:hypothetical protein M8J76_016491 [Diaphorina citri]|nr:hypothetical protein M8J75_000645 [Diaphorina citri]KAI5737757.1 hypothetical protein M8J76_016491 [Diaphorina citri]